MQSFSWEIFWKKKSSSAGKTFSETIRNFPSAGKSFSWKIRNISRAGKTYLKTGSGSKRKNIICRFLNETPWYGSVMVQQNTCYKCSKKTESGLFGTGAGFFVTAVESYRTGSGFSWNRGKSLLLILHKSMATVVFLEI